MVKRTAGTKRLVLETLKTASQTISAARAYTPSTTINYLPQEMLLEIFKQLLYIPHSQSISYQQLLCNLCRVKLLQPAATEILYGSEYIYRTECTDHLLLRTLLGNPRLAALVRHLRFNPSCSYLSCSGQRQQLGVPRESFRRAIDGLNLSDAEDSRRWRNTFDSRICDGALNALLMLHTPNVTSITIHGYGPWWSPSDAHEEQPWD
jgi:hypothetical protein